MYFQAVTELKYFAIYSGCTSVVMGCSIPLVDYYYEHYVKAKRVQRLRVLNEEPESISLWERGEWSMPMRYLGGVVGFAWAASV